MARNRSLVIFGFAIVAALAIISYSSFGHFNTGFGIHLGNHSLGQIDGHPRYMSLPAKSAITIAGQANYRRLLRTRNARTENLRRIGAVWRGLVYRGKLGHQNHFGRGSRYGRAESFRKAASSIWTIPNPNEWTLIINSRTGQYHLDYDSGADFGRTKMNLKTLAAAVEKFKIDLRSDGGNKGTLALDWETTEASVPFTVSQ